VTDSERARRALLEASASRLRALVEQSGDGVVIVAEDGTILEWSPALVSISGVGREEAVGRPIFAVLGSLAPGEPTPAAIAWGRFRALLESATGPVREERVIRRRDGARRELQTVAFRIVEGERAVLAALVRDLTAVKDAERALRDSEERCRALFERSVDAVCVNDLTGRFLEANQAALSLLGYSAADLARLGLADLVAPEQRPVVHAVCELVGSGRPSPPTVLALRRPDGLAVEMEIQAVPITRQGQPVAMQVVVRDLRERRRAEKNLGEIEAQLRQAQKLEAVGLLAGGVAHDFNNQLGVILACVDLALGRVPDGDPLRDDLAEIRRAADTSARLTRQLLAFSRKQILQPTVLDVNDLIRELSRMLRRLIGEDIDLSCSLAPEPACVRADRGQLEQVLMNLVVNARDAMSKGGRLTIETALVELTGDFARRHVGTRPGPHVLVAVTDTGCGMDRALLARIFEPFFTTKPVAKGTGLGLSLVYGIVKQSGGTIWVYSEPGLGTTFKIYLPQVAAPTAFARGAPAPTLAARGDETVLVVEDDTALRKVTVRILRRAGFRVVEAENGPEALLVSEAHQGPLHLLLTDIIMPQMSGPQLADELRARFADLRVLFMSGYAGEAVVRHGFVDSGQRFVGKPFTGPELIAAVRGALDAASPDRQA
jgi:two-component system, cell cycle sensor histidine kinase and response regulator CckA